MSGVVSMGPEMIRLGMRLEVISLNHSVRILHHLLLHTFGALMRFVHALVPFVFPLQVGTMIQRISFQILPDCVGDIRPRDTAHHKTRYGLSSSSRYGPILFLDPLFEWCQFHREELSSRGHIHSHVRPLYHPADLFSDFKGDSWPKDLY